MNFVNAYIQGERKYMTAEICMLRSRQYSNVKIQSLKKALRCCTPCLMLEVNVKPTLYIKHTRYPF